MVSTVTDVEQALINARVLEDYWMSNGWESLESEDLLLGEIEKESSEVLDIYPLVEIDISVTITIKLPDKIYVVPLEDVSSLNVNDCLIIGVSDLYTDWENRVWEKIEESNLIHHSLSFSKESEGECYICKYLGTDHKVRIVRTMVY